MITSAPSRRLSGAPSGLPPQGMRGVSLVEALVALVILLIGLLGLASLTINSIRFTDDALQRSSAIGMAYDIADRMRANAAARKNYVTAYSEVPTAGTDCSAVACDANQLAAWDLAQWKTALGRLLPAGQGQIEQSPSGNQMDIMVLWSDRETTRSYQLTVSFNS